MFKYFRPSARVHQTWIQSTTKYRGLIQDSVYQCDTGCRRTEAVSNCCLRRHKTQCDRQSCWWVAVCPLPRDDTLNTPFAEYLAFSLIFSLFFYRCPINSVVPPVPPLSEFLGGTCPRQLYGAGACSGVGKWVPAAAGKEGRYGSFRLQMNVWVCR